MHSLLRRYGMFLVPAVVLHVGALVHPGHAAEWQSLFNGRDLVGWSPVHDAVFEARDGELRLVRGTGWLRTEREYGDFILELELRPLVERYDSGLFFRAGLEGKPWPTEAWLVNLRRDLWGTLVRNFKTIHATDLEGPDIEDETPWAKFRLEVRGSRATLTVNGREVWSHDQVTPRRGFLGIQAEDRAFAFRNLRIQALDDAPRPSP